VRPISSLLAILAASVPVMAVEGSVIASRGSVHDIELATIVRAPVSLTESAVRFQAVFYGLTDIYDREATIFRPERHIPIGVWDVRANLWDPEARAGVQTGLYVNRDFVTANELNFLRKYQAITLEGRIRSIVDGRVYIEITSIKPVVGQQGASLGAFTDQVIWEIEQAVQLAADGARDLAEERFATAAQADLPIFARAELALIRGRNLAAAGQAEAAAGVFAAGLELAQAIKGYPAANLAQLHVGLAKVRSDLAEQNQGVGRDLAVESARQALALDPGIGEAYAVLGISLAGLGQYDEARRQCDIAVRMRPTDPEIRWYLGRILDQQGRHDEAIEALKRAIDLTPKDARLHKAIAAAYLNKGRAGGAGAAAALDTALKECDITLRLSPGDARVMLMSGQILEEAVRQGAEVTVAGQRQPATMELAVARYQAAVAADPKSVEAYEVIARQQIRSGKIDEALATAAALANMSATPANRLLATTLSGCAHWAADNVPATRSALLPIVGQLVDTEARLALGWSSIAAGDADTAKAMATALSSVQGSDVLEFRGWQLATSGDAAGGERLLRQAAIQDPARNGYLLGMAIYFQGEARWHDAVPLLEAAKSITGRPSLFAQAAKQAEAALRIMTSRPATAIPAPAVPVAEQPEQAVPPAAEPAAVPAVPVVEVVPQPAAEVPMVEAVPENVPAVVPAPASVVPAEPVVDAVPAGEVSASPLTEVPVVDPQPAAPQGAAPVAP
jgi:tetratricopeptide (TPR) repeat protein